MDDFPPLDLSTAPALFALLAFLAAGLDAWRALLFELPPLIRFPEPVFFTLDFELSDLLGLPPMFSSNTRIAFSAETFL